MKSKASSRVLAFALATTLTLLAGTTAPAANANWTGASGTSANWSDPANWSSAVPAAGDNLVFAAGAQQINTNDLTLASSGWVQFNSTSGDYWLYGNGLTIAGLTNILGNNVFFLPLTNAAAQFWDVTDQTTLAVSNTLTLGATLTFSGVGNSTLAGAVSGAGGIVQNGSGTLLLSGANTQTGGMIVNAGYISAQTPNAGGYGGVGNGNLVVNGGTVTMVIDNGVFGQGVGITAPRSVTLNTNGLLTTSDRSGHIPVLILNGGTSSASTTRNDWGNWNLDLGVLTLTNGSYSKMEGASAGSGNVTLGQTGGTVFNIGAGDTVEVAMSISHTANAADLGLIKTGDGLLRLTGINTYTSATTIQRGTLELFGGSIDTSPSITIASNGVLNVQNSAFSIGANQTLAGTGRIIGTVMDNNAGAILSPGGNGAAGTLTIDTLSLGGNATLNFDLANVTTEGGGINDLLVVTNFNLSFLATNAVNLNFLSGSPALGTYTLIRYQAGPAAGTVTTLAASASRYSYAFTSDGSSIKLTVTGTPASLVWKGDGVSNVWDLVTTPNWLKNGTPDIFYQADSVSFTDAGSNSPSVNIFGTVLPSAVTVSAGKDYSFSGSGKISGSATLAKTGTGTLTINNANDYSGATTVTSGTVNLQAAAAISGPLTLNAGAVNVNVGSALAGQATVNGGTLTINATSGATASGNTVNNGGNLVFNAGGSSGSAAGTVNVNAGGTNTLLAGNAYGYSGSAWVRTLNINGGLVDDRISGDNGWGITINMTGGELRSNGGVSANNAGPLFALGGGSAINILANATPAVASGRINIRDGNPGDILPITVADGPADPDFLVTAAISSASSARAFSKNGPGSMVLAGNNNYNSPTIINAGTLQIGAGGTVGAIGTGNITNNASLVFNRSDALTVSAPIYGSGTVQNIGPGALLLNGSSTYSGATTVSAGTLQGTGTINSSVTVQSGANLSAGGVLGTGTLNLSNVTVNAGGGLVLDLSSTAATSDLLNVRGTLALGAPTPVTFNFLGGTPYTGGPYTLITNWVAGRGNNLTYNNQTRYAVNLDNSQPNRVQVTFSGNNGNLVWKGNVNSLWNLNTDANWLNGGTAATYYQSDAVVFDDNGVGTPNVSLSADMTPANVTVNSSGNFSFSGGGIGGVGSLVKSGTGTLTIANALTHTGGTAVNGGTLQIGNGGTTGFLAGNIGVFSSLVFNRSDTVTCPGLISGSGTLTQAGTGTLLLTGNNTFFGGATVNSGGTVQVGNGALVDSGMFGNGPVVNQGSIVYNRASQITILAPHSGNGSFAFLGTGGNSQSGYQMNATNTFTGPVTVSQSRLWSTLGALGLGNPSSLTVQSGGQVFVTAVPYSSTVSLPVSITGIGWLEGTAPGAMGALRIQNGLNWAGPITLAGNARISTYSDAASNVISGTISGPYELELGANSGGFLSLAPGAANSFSALRLSAGTTWMDNANALPADIPLAMNGGTLKLNGNNLTITSLSSPGGGSIQNASSTSPVTVTVNPPTDSSYSGTFVDGGPKTLALVKTGGARLTLSGLSTAMGGVTVNGGTLALAAGGGNGVIRGTVTMQPGTLLLSLNNDSFGYNGGASQVTNLNLNGAALIHTPNNNLTLWQNLTVNMTGAYMAATNTGGNARLDLGTGASINTFPSAVSSVIAGARLYLRQGNTIFNVADGAAADDLVVTAPILQDAAGYGITKNGAGRMKVMDAFGPTGAITVNGGSLVLAGAASALTNSGTITLAAGTTFDTSIPGGVNLAANQVLQGGGTLVGNVADNTGTVIRPGSDTGTLTIQGSLTLNGSGSLGIKLANVTTTGSGVNDLIQVNGDLSVNDFAPTMVNFTFLNGAPITSGTYTFLKYTGNLTGSAAGFTNSAGSAVAAISVDTFAKAVKVSFTVPGQTLVWQGDGLNNYWDFDTTSLNWFNGAASTNFYQLDTVRFDDSRTTLNTTVNLNGAVTPASLTVDSTNNYTFTTITGGKLTGATTITKNNTNIMTLGGANDFTGTVTVNGGVLMQESGTTTSPLGGFGNKVFVSPGAAFDFNGNRMASISGRGYSFTIGGAGPDGTGALVNSSATSVQEFANVSNLTLTADAVIGGNARFDMGSGQTNTTVNGGGFKLIKTGPNEVDLRAQTVTNVAAIVITNGDLYHENFDRTNTWEVTVTNYAVTGGRLGVYGGRYFNMPIVLDAGGLYNRGGGTPNWISPIRLDSGSVFYNNAAQNLYGVIYGSGAMWVNGGTSVLTVTNANTYAGGTVISNAPTTTTAADATSGSAAIVATLPSALGTGPITVSGLGYGSLSTNLAFFGSNVFRAVEFNFTGPTTVANNIVLPSVTVSNASLHGRDNNQVINLTGVVSGGFAGFTNWIDFGVAGNGVFRYANTANSFLGTVTVFRGLLGITGDGSLGNSANVLRINSPAGLRFDAPDINVAHNVYMTLASTFSLLGDNNGDGTPETINNATISGLLSGSVAITVRGTNGVLTLTGNNSGYSGGFELQEPVVLQVASSANLGTAYVAPKAGSTFRYTGTGSETMTRTIWNDSATLGGGTIEIPSASAVLTWNPGGGTCNQNVTKTGAGTLVYGGSISGGAVVQVNGGTLTLTGNNSYSGPTLVNNGTLRVNGSLPVANSVVVASGSTLGGTGTINCPVALQAGSFLQPGAAPNTVGTLTVRGTLALAGTTTMEIDGTAGTSDRLTGMGTVTYGGDLVVNNLTGTPAVGTKFTLFSAVDRLGTFNSVTLPPVSAPLYWTNMLAIDGSIQLLSTVNLTPVNVTWGVSNGKLNLSWPTDHIGWRLVVQTNAINVGLVTNTASWSTWPNSANVNSVSVPLDPANPTVFYKLVYP